MGVVVLLLFVGVGILFINLNNRQVDEIEEYEFLDEPIGSTAAANNATRKISGQYFDYYSGVFDNFEPGNTIILFFKANWCGTCSDLDKDIQANQAKIPKNIYILKVDFDKDIAMTAKYGVSVQHTLVATTYNGEMLRRWTGSRSLKEILDHVMPAAHADEYTR